MFASQLGFLHSTPKDWEETRGEYAERTGGPHGLPFFQDVSYLCRAFIDSGLKTDSAMGEAPFTWGDVLAYSQSTQNVSTPWELTMIKEMSRAYLVGRENGGKALAMAPVEQDENKLLLESEETDG